MSYQQFTEIIALAIKYLEESDINSAIITLSVIQAVAQQSQPPVKQTKLRVV